MPARTASPNTGLLDLKGKPVLNPCVYLAIMPADFSLPFFKGRVKGRLNARFETSAMFEFN